MPGSRPFELIEIDLSKTGKERAAIKNGDMAAFWHDGWDVAYCWIATRQEVEQGKPKGPEEQFLMVVMGPPRSTPSSRAAGAMSELVSQLEEDAARPPPAPDPVSRWRPLWGSLAVVLALAGWVVAIASSVLS